jgi:hypothetical protein
MHLVLFALLTLLYAEGGIATDFSSVFLPGFVPQATSSGYVLCLVDGEHTQMQETGATFLLSFPEAQNPAIKCVLDAYDKPSFHRCLSDDLDTGGSLCVKAMLQACFSLHGLTNALESNVFSADTLDTLSADAFKVLEQKQVTTHPALPLARAQTRMMT